MTKPSRWFAGAIYLLGGKRPRVADPTPPPRPRPKPKK